MHQQVSAERKKRAEILESEVINVTQSRYWITLTKAYKLKLINQAQGESESITLKATANANAISLIAQTLKQPHATEALSLGLAEKYIEAFGGLAKEGNTLIVPANVSDVGGFVASAMKIVQNCGINETEKMTSLKVPGK
jgi:regulator of protease activity HflC (stomatin/prohibitin superfamily)